MSEPRDPAHGDIEGLELRVATRIPALVASVVFCAGVAGCMLAFTDVVGVGTPNDWLFLACWLGGIVATPLGAVFAAKLLTAPPYLGRRGPIVVDERGAHARGRLFLSRDAIIAAHREAERIHVVDRDLNELVIVARTKGDASEVAARLGVAAEATIARFRVTSLAVRSGVFWLTAVLTALLVLALPAFWGPPSIAIPPIATLLLLGNLPAVIVVGRDGVHGRWLWRHYRVSLDDVRGVAMNAHAVVVQYWSGGSAAIGIRSGARAEALRQHLGEAAAARGEKDEADLVQSLARHGRSLEQWIGDLRALMGDRRGYRASSAPREMLWRVVESAATGPEERAAAGIALAAATDPATHARLLAAARGTAHPTLRSILTALGNGAEADARELARLEAAS